MRQREQDEEKLCSNKEEEEAEEGVRYDGRQDKMFYAQVLLGGN